MNLITRLTAAFNLLTKGSQWPFDQIPGNSAAPQLNKDRAYEKSVWVQRAIKKVAQPISAVSLQFSKDFAGSEQLIENPALTSFWSKPAKGLSRSDWIEASVGWLKLAGEFFWILDDAHLSMPFPEMRGPRQIILARPDRMKHVCDDDGNLVGWEFTDGQKRKWNLLPEQVIHQRYWNPYSEHRGLGEVEAAMIAVESDFYAGLFARNLLKNSGDRGPYIVAKSGIPDDTQRKQIIAQLREKRRRAATGDFAPVFLTGDISVEDPQVQLPDQSFIQHRMRNRHEIFIALGVPASMADIVASYSVGSASDRFLLIEETCMPTAEKLAEGVQTATLRIFGEDVFAWFNWDEHSVMRQVRAERLESMTKLTERGMPVKDANNYLQLGLPDYPGWEVGLVPFSVQRLEDVVNPPEPEPFNLPPEGEGAEDPEDEESASKMLRRAFDKTTLETKARDHALWRLHMSRRQPHHRAFRSKFTRALQPARMEVLRKIALLTADKSPVTKAAAHDLMFDLPSFKDGLVSLMRTASIAALTDAIAQQSADLGKDDPFTMPPEEVTQFLKNRQNFLKDVADDVFDQIRNSLIEGIEAGESTKKLTDRVKGAFNGLSRDRATRIAVTETAAAYGAGNDRVMKASGIAYKKWVTSGLDNVRAEHAAANGQVVRMNEPFNVGGEPLEHPGDSAHGSPWNTINCNCISIPVDNPEGATS